MRWARAFQLLSFHCVFRLFACSCVFALCCHKAQQWSCDVGSGAAETWLNYWCKEPFGFFTVLNTFVMTT